MSYLGRVAGRLASSEPVGSAMPRPGVFGMPTLRLQSPLVQADQRLSVESFSRIEPGANLRRRWLGKHSQELNEDPELDQPSSATPRALVNSEHATTVHTAQRLQPFAPHGVEQPEASTEPLVVPAMRGTSAIPSSADAPSTSKATVDAFSVAMAQLNDWLGGGTQPLPVATEPELPTAFPKAIAGRNRGVLLAEVAEASPTTQQTAQAETQPEARSERQSVRHSEPFRARLAEVAPTSPSALQRAAQRATAPIESTSNPIAAPRRRAPELTNTEIGERPRSIQSPRQSTLLARPFETERVAAPAPPPPPILSIGRIEVEVILPQKSPAPVAMPPVRPQPVQAPRATGGLGTSPRAFGWRQS
ncbi:MAG TPA: hypothetical protein VIV60_29285 [Polyangiaceae bacterium]